jgi:hypothetical protein
VSCTTCQGKGWVYRTGGWPAECTDCTPTKVVKGRTVLDIQAVKRKALDAQPRPLPVAYTPMKRVKINCSTHQYFAYDDEEQ